MAKNLAAEIMGDITNIEKITREARVLKEENRQLELLKQEADNENKEKSIFLANMGHEIKTPVNVIVATIQLLQSTNISMDQMEYIKILKESSDTLLLIINDLLNISKIKSSNFKLTESIFDLKETINSIYTNLLIAGNSKGLEVSYYLDPNISSQVLGDELRLKQVITNLINNAVKFTDEGYISFRIKVVSSDDKTERIEFRIKDSGIGIADSFKEKIFGSFSQGDLSPIKKYMGTGLGLAISKQLATLMNGDVWFESVIGYGATFFFTCELKKSNKEVQCIAENSIIEEKIEINNLENDKVILYVEDNLINQEVMESILKRKGYKYIGAYNGNEGLEVLKNNKIDLILMDIQMPELDGFQTTKIIREEEPKGSHIPIIALTAYALIEDREKCIKAGMDDYITKPFEIESLYELIKIYIRE